MASYGESQSVNRFVGQMELSLKNYQEEIDRLRQELTILCDEAGRKTRVEVDKVQAYNDAKISRLSDQIQTLESVSSSIVCLRTCV